MTQTHRAPRYDTIEPLVVDLHEAREITDKAAREDRLKVINGCLWPETYPRVAAAAGVTPGMTVSEWVKKGVK